MALALRKRNPIFPLSYSSSCGVSRTKTQDAPQLSAKTQTRQAKEAFCTPHTNQPRITSQLSLQFKNLLLKTSYQPSVDVLFRKNWATLLNTVQSSTLQCSMVYSGQEVYIHTHVHIYVYVLIYRQMCTYIYINMIFHMWIYIYISNSRQPPALRCRPLRSSSHCSMAGAQDPRRPLAAGPRRSNWWGPSIPCREGAWAKRG